MRMRPGEQAKSFSVEDYKGQLVSLEDYRGKNLLLTFHRYASCPFCNERVEEIIESYDELTGMGLSVVGFFQSPKESIEKYVGKQKPPYPIIPDADHTVYGQYGIEFSWRSFIAGMANMPRSLRAMAKFRPGRIEGAINTMPADFLIGPDLIVERTHYGKDAADHFSLDEIREWLLSKEDKVASETS